MQVYASQYLPWIPWQQGPGARMQFPTGVCCDLPTGWIFKDADDCIHGPFGTYDGAVYSAQQQRYNPSQFYIPTPEGAQPMAQKKTLYEYAVVFNPTSGDKSEKSQVLVAPKTTLATSDQAVRTLAAREIPESFLERLDEVEVIVRPFKNAQ